MEHLLEEKLKTRNTNQWKFKENSLMILPTKLS